MAQAAAQRRNLRRTHDLLMERFGGIEGYVEYLHRDLKLIFDRSQSPTADRKDVYLALQAHRLVKSTQLDVDRGEHDDARLAMDHEEATGIVLQEVLAQLQSNPVLRQRLAKEVARIDMPLLLEMTKDTVLVEKLAAEVDHDEPPR